LLLTGEQLGRRLLPPVSFHSHFHPIRSKKTPTFLLGKAVWVPSFHWQLLGVVGALPRRMITLEK
jgi:hypothetical protein